jgi:hypothetical protein
VTVERVADNLRHVFQWAVFLPQSFSGTAQQTFEIASGFLLSVASPRRFNIHFHDSETADNFRQSLIELQRLWRDTPPEDRTTFPPASSARRLRPLLDVTGCRRQVNGTAALPSAPEAEFRLSSSSRSAYQRVPRTPTGKVHKPRLCQTPTATSPSTPASVKGDRRNSCRVTCYRSLTVKRNTDRSLDEGSCSTGAELWVERGLPSV